MDTKSPAINDQSKYIWFCQGCKRDPSLRDRDETETFGFCFETRPRPRPSCNSTRPRRDRDVWCLPRDETETLQGQDRDVFRDLQPSALCQSNEWRLLHYKNSSGDEIVNVNFLRWQRTVHVEASAYARWTDFLICMFEYQLHYITLWARSWFSNVLAANHLCTYADQTKLSESVLPR